MLRVIAILAVSLSAFAVGQTQSTIDEIHLRATVQAVVPLSSFSGRVTPVDFDPRFALTVHVESAVPAVANFTEGAVVTLAIHSPSLLFAEEPTKGKAYSFVLHRKVRKGKAKFFGLRVAHGQLFISELVSLSEDALRAVGFRHASCSGSSRSATPTGASGTIHANSEMRIRQNCNLPASGKG
jgi:hypothetical protein